VLVSTIMHQLLCYFQTAMNEVLEKERGIYDFSYLRTDLGTNLEQIRNYE